MRLVGGDNGLRIAYSIYDFEVLHAFDRQISDKQGNLVEDEHLDLFDHLVAVCKERDLYTVLTPIA